jgi:ribosomal-protein-alanine N-acetyltransferase
VKDFGSIEGAAMILGEKVILRAVEPQDIRQLWEWMQDEEIMRYRDYPAPPRCFAEAVKAYEESLGKETNDLRLAITTREGVLIGETGLRNVDLRTDSADFLIAIGNKAYWGQGFGTDATLALVKYAFHQINLHRITLYVHSFNARAIRVYEKCGFKHEGVLREAQYMDGRHSDVLMMGLLRSDFESAMQSESRAA